MNTKTLLTTIAIIEVLTGVGLLLAPSTAAGLLIGQPLDGAAALVVARVAGAALVAMGVICWLERLNSSMGLLTGLLVYNIAVPLVVLHSHFVHGTNGAVLWAAAVVHLAVVAWIVACLSVRSGTRVH